MRVLLVEDDQTLGHALREWLAAQGYVVDWLTGAEQPVSVHDVACCDLMVLDLNLPGRSGLDILRDTRAHGLQLPVLILTARDSLEDRVAGLDAGADDYLTKPFEAAELAARLRVLARRRSGQARSVLEAGPLVLDMATREVRADGERLNLSVRELSVLEMLMSRCGSVVTKQQMVQSLSATDADFSENAVEVYIYRLRRRLAGTTAVIQTVRGFGYLLDVDAHA